MTEQILKARDVSRETLRSNVRVEDRLVFNRTYHPLLRDFQKVLNEAQVLLTSKEEHKTFWGEKPFKIGRCKARTIKDYLVRAKN